MDARSGIRPLPKPDPLLVKRFSFPIERSNFRYAPGGPDASLDSRCAETTFQDAGLPSYEAAIVRVPSIAASPFAPRNAHQDFACLLSIFAAAQHNQKVFSHL
jgi:hypothetical protein